jgi:protease IV
MVYGGMEDSNVLTSLVENAAADSKVKGILLDVNSPGGFSIGGLSLADAVNTASKIKPVIAHIGGVGASLGYLIASQANSVIANRDAQVGSIGVYNVNIDRTRMIENAGIKVEVFKNKEAKYKTMGHVGTSLNEDHRAHLAQRAQSSFDEFKSMVLAKRPGVCEDCMQGQLFTGEQAVKNGLVDSCGSIFSAMQKLQQRIK